MKINRRNFLKATAASAALFSLSACGASEAQSGGDVANENVSFKVAVPNDTTNEARALILLEKFGFFTLAEGIDITATKNDIAENPLNITIDEIEAAQIPNILQDEDYAVINSNYAISAGLNPIEDALGMEDASSPYVNILVCKTGNEEVGKIKALAAALSSQKVYDFIIETYGGAVVPTVENLTDGFDADLDYTALEGEKVTCAASPAPHSEILEVAAEILAAKGITLEIQEFTDYIIPNKVVDDGSVDCNFFQHLPYLEDFNAENGTELSSVAGIHVEPMGIYGGKQTSLDPITGA